mmetsp:Transcript_22781/g.52205  ORF Transcript_22781/g.52205 Transcript_22781/m.52205 type:complete len:169 (-) Transcript_22781:2-508(-)
MRSSQNTERNRRCSERTAAGFFGVSDDVEESELLRSAALETTATKPNDANAVLNRPMGLPVPNVEDNPPVIAERAVPEADDGDDSPPRIRRDVLQIEWKEGCVAEYWSGPWDGFRVRPSPGLVGADGRHGIVAKDDVNTIRSDPMINMILNGSFIAIMMVKMLYQFLI